MPLTGNLLLKRWYIGVLLQLKPCALFKKHIIRNMWCLSKISSTMAMSLQEKRLSSAYYMGQPVYLIILLNQRRLLELAADIGVALTSWKMSSALGPPLFFRTSL